MIIVCCVAWLGTCNLTSVLHLFSKPVLQMNLLTFIAFFAYIKGFLRTIQNVQSSFKAPFNYMSIKLKFLTALVTPFGHEFYLAFVYAYIFLQNTLIRYFLEGTNSMCRHDTLSAGKYHPFFLKSC